MRPLVDGIRVRWIGTVAGQERNSLVASARVALFPLQWEEPGGTAVVEALALGTPAVGLSRGCLPELVEHGRTGWLAKSPDDLAALVQAAGTRTCTSSRFLDSSRQRRKKLFLIVPDRVPAGQVVRPSRVGRPAVLCVGPSPFGRK